MVFFVVFANAFQGVREADRAMIANAQILGASRSDHDDGHHSLGHELDPRLSARLLRLRAGGRGGGEFLGAKQGVGLLIATAQGAFNANGVFAAMIILAVLALVMEFLITLVENAS